MRVRTERGSADRYEKILKIKIVDSMHYFLIDQEFTEVQRLTLQINPQMTSDQYNYYNQEISSNNANFRDPTNQCRKLFEYCWDKISDMLCNMQTRQYTSESLSKKPFMEILYQCNCVGTPPLMEVFVEMMYHQVRYNCDLSIYDINSILYKIEIIHRNKYSSFLTLKTIELTVRNTCSGEDNQNFFQRVFLALKPILEWERPNFQRKAVTIIIATRLGRDGIARLLIETECLESLFNMVKLQQRSLETIDEGFRLLNYLTQDRNSLTLLNQFDSLNIIKGILHNEYYDNVRQPALQLLINYAKGGPVYINTIYASKVMTEVFQLLEREDLIYSCLEVYEQIIKQSELHHIGMLFRNDFLYWIHNQLRKRNSLRFTRILDLQQHVYQCFGDRYVAEIREIEKYRRFVNNRF